MKKSFLVFVGLLLATSYTTFADADHTVRKNCWGFISWRYKTLAKTKKIGNSWNSSNSNTCNKDITSYSESINGGGGIAGFIPRAKAYAQAGPNIADYHWTWIESGYINRFQAGHSNDFAASALAFAPMYDNGAGAANPDLPSGAGSNTYVKSGEVTFDETNHSVTIPIDYAKLQVIDPDLANAFATIKVFIYDSKNITEAQAEQGNYGQLITSCQAIILNGVLYTMNINANSFTAIGNNGYELSNFTTTISIPQQISLDDVTIRFGSDVGSLANGIAPDYKMTITNAQLASMKLSVTTNSKLSFDVLSNPIANNTLKYLIKPGNMEYSDGSIALISVDGRTINKAIFKGNINALYGNTQSIDLSALPKGIYYLVLTTNTGEKFSRKIIKE